MSGKTYDLCVFHSQCPDGFGAAWAVRKALGDIEFQAGISGAPVDIESYRGRSVVLVDFCWPRAVVEAVASVAERLTIIDHHDTAARDTNGLTAPNLRLHFDMSRSGAALAWRYFHDAPAPSLIDYIEDYDLFKRQLPECDEVNLALTSHPFEFAIWDKLNVEDLRNEGRAISRWMKAQVERIAKSAGRIHLAGYDVPAANAPRCFADRLGHHLAENEPFAVVWAVAGGRIHFSLRSRTDGEAVNRIAETYGGRGHLHAAVFSLKTGSLEALDILGLTHP